MSVFKAEENNRATIPYIVQGEIFVPFVVESETSTASLYNAEFGYQSEGSFSVELLAPYSWKVTSSMEGISFDTLFSNSNSMSSVFYTSNRVIDEPAKHDLVFSFQPSSSSALSTILQNREFPSRLEMNTAMIRDGKFSWDIKMMRGTNQSDLHWETYQFLKDAEVSKVWLKGDVDGDGVVGPLDLTAIQRYLSGGQSYDQDFLDCNADKVVDEFDRQCVALSMELFPRER